MYPKIIFVLATVCVVNASVLTVNDDDAESEVKVRPSRCNFKACDWLCRSLNKTSGTCVNGRCKCEKSLITTDLDDMTDPAELFSPVGCNSRACQQQCLRLGYPRGACVKGVCKCDYLLNTEDTVTESNVEEDSVQSRACNNNRCKQICRKQKFRGGACVGANCYCNKFLSLQDETLIDSAENLSLLSCNSIACDDQCRRTGWHSGVCINGQCKCDYFLNAEVDAVDEYSELATRRICDVRKCNRACTRRGYAGARCVNGRCQCYDKIEREDKSPLSDVTSNENEKTIETLRMNEEEPIEAAPSACNTVSCNQLCHRLKYAGGWCRFGQCQCY